MLQPGVSFGPQICVTVSITYGRHRQRGRTKQYEFPAPGRAFESRIHPSITAPSPALANESTSIPQQPGVLIGNVAVVDPDGDAGFTFLVDDPRFQVVGDSTAGYNLYLKPGLSLRLLDAATIPAILITATDAGGLSLTSPYTVVVNQIAQCANGDRAQQPVRHAQRGGLERGPALHIRSERGPLRGECTRRIHLFCQRPSISSGERRTRAHAGPIGASVGRSDLAPGHLNRRDRSLRGPDVQAGNHTSAPTSGHSRFSPTMTEGQMFNAVATIVARPQSLRRLTTAMVVVRSELTVSPGNTLTVPH